MIYPEPEKAGRKKAGPLLPEKAISTGLLAKARAVLGTEFVTPHRLAAPANRRDVTVRQRPLVLPLIYWATTKPTLRSVDLLD